MIGMTETGTNRDDRPPARGLAEVLVGLDSPNANAKRDDSYANYSVENGEKNGT